MVINICSIYNIINKKEKMMFRRKAYQNKRRYCESITVSKVIVFPLMK